MPRAWMQRARGLGLGGGGWIERDEELVFSSHLGPGLCDLLQIPFLPVVRLLIPTFLFRCSSETHPMHHIPEQGYFFVLSLGREMSLVEAGDAPPPHDHSPTLLCCSFRGSSCP